MPVIGMTEAARAVLTSLEGLGRDNDAGQQDRTRKMLNLERDTAEFLHLLLRATDRKRVPESRCRVVSQFEISTLQ